LQSPLFDEIFQLIAGTYILLIRFENVSYQNLKMGIIHAFQIVSMLMVLTKYLNQKTPSFTPVTN